MELISTPHYSPVVMHTVFWLVLLCGLKAQGCLKLRDTAWWIRLSGEVTESRQVSCYFIFMRPRFCWHKQGFKATVFFILVKTQDSCAISVQNHVMPFALYKHNRKWENCDIVPSHFTSSVESALSVNEIQVKYPFSYSVNTFCSTVISEQEICSELLKSDIQFVSHFSCHSQSSAFDSLQAYKSPYPLLHSLTIH